MCLHTTLYDQQLYLLVVAMHSVLSLAYIHDEMWFSKLGCVALGVGVVVSMKLESYPRKSFGTSICCLNIAPG